MVCEAALAVQVLGHMMSATGGPTSTVSVTDPGCGAEGAKPAPVSSGGLQVNQASAASAPHIGPSPLAARGIRCHGEGISSPLVLLR